MCVVSLALNMWNTFENIVEIRIGHWKNGCVFVYVAQTTRFVNPKLKSKKPTHTPLKEKRCPINGAQIML